MFLAPFVFTQLFTRSERPGLQYEIWSSPSKPFRPRTIKLYHYVCVLTSDQAMGKAILIVLVCPRHWIWRTCPGGPLAAAASHQQAGNAQKEQKAQGVGDSGDKSG